MDESSQNNVLINNSRTAFPTSIFDVIFKFPRQFSIKCIYLSFFFSSQKGVDNFEIEHKICSFLVRGAVPP